MPPALVAPAAFCARVALAFPARTDSWISNVASFAMPCGNVLRSSASPTHDSPDLLVASKRSGPSRRSSMTSFSVSGNATALRAAPNILARFWLSLQDLELHCLLWCFHQVNLYLWKRKAHLESRSLQHQCRWNQETHVLQRSAVLELCSLERRSSIARLPKKQRWSEAPGEWRHCGPSICRKSSLGVEPPKMCTWHATPPGDRVPLNPEEKSQPPGSSRDNIEMADASVIGTETVLCRNAESRLQNFPR